METTNKELIKQTLNEGTNLVIEWGVTEELTKEEQQLLLMFLCHSYEGMVSVELDEVWAMETLTFENLIEYNQEVGINKALNTKSKIIKAFMSLQEKGLVDIDNGTIYMSLSPLRYNKLSTYSSMMKTN